MPRSSNKRQAVSVRNERKSIWQLLILLVVVVSVPACMHQTVHRIEVPVPFRLPSQLPPGAERLPFNVGIYYGPEFKSYEHYDRTYGESGFATPVGKFSVRQFDSMFYAMFVHTQLVDDRPPYAANDPASKLQAIIEPRIERFQMNAESFTTSPLTARVEYRFKLYSPEGTTLDTWDISATDVGKSPWAESGIDVVGARTEAVVRKASIQFMQKFYGSPALARRLSETRKNQIEAARIKKEVDAAFDVSASAVASGAAAIMASTQLVGVDVSASLYWQVGLTQVPIGRASAKSPVLATRLTIKNGRTKSIVFDPARLRLHTNRFSSLSPDSARTVAERMLRDSGSSDGGGAAAIFFGPAGGAIFGAFAAINQANLKDEMLRQATDSYRHEQLRGQNIAPDQTVSGVAYFIALGIDGKLDQPELRVRIEDPSQGKTFETALNMKTGTATAGTLVLAGLKPPGSVAEKAPRTKASQQDKEVAVPAKDVERIALLPADGWNLPWGGADADTEENIENLARKILSESGQVIVDRSAQKSYYRGNVWTGTGWEKELDRAYVAAEGRKLKVDGVLAFKYVNRGTYGAFVAEIDVTLVDVATNRVFSASGGFDDAKKNTETVLRSFTQSKGHQSRQHAGTTTATGSTLLLAGSSPESGGGKTETVNARQQSEENIVSAKAGILSAGGSVKIALLPADGWALASASSSSVTEEELHKLARETLVESGQVIVDRSQKEGYYRGNVWTGAGWSKELNLAYAVGEGRKLKVDGILTFKYLVRGIGGAYIVETDVTLIDVATGRVYHESGTSRDTRKNTESVLDAFLMSKKH